MSLVNYYKCDVCDKELKQSELMRFKRERKDIRECFSHWMGHYKVKDYEIIDFDICKTCFERIRSEIKKEGN